MSEHEHAAGAGQLELPFGDGFIVGDAMSSIETVHQTGVDVRNLALAPLRFAGRLAGRSAFALVGAATMLHAVPYHTHIDGLAVRVEGSIGPRPGLSFDTTLGSREFPHVDGLPIGVHVAPDDVDAIKIAGQANPDVKAYMKSLQTEARERLPEIELVLGSEIIGGALLGLLVAGGVGAASRHYRQLGRKPGSLKRGAWQVAGLTAAVAASATYGAASWNSDWAKDSRLTGTFAAMEGLGGDLSQYYSKQSKAYEVTQAILSIQSGSQQELGASGEATAYDVMYISDMHLVNTWPLLQKYINAYGVKLIVNTGDEGEFGVRGELTPEYLDAMRAVAAKTPMLWIAGNHDSPETIAVMRSIPGVTVLGTKEKQPDGSFKVGAQRVNVYGLNVGGLPDPRVYGAKGVSGASDDAHTNALEISAADAALKNSGDTDYDIFATHEPIAAEEIIKLLGKGVRQLNYGHVHKQNNSDDIQKGSVIRLQEGSTGEGGLDHIGSQASPVEFTIAQWTVDCQEPKLLRFSIDHPMITQMGQVSIGGSVTVDTIYLSPQKLTAGRHCDVQQGVGPVQDILPGMDLLAKAAGSTGK